MNEELVKDAVERTFNISPGTVYGVLVGLLLLGLIYALYKIGQKDRKLLKINEDNIQVLTSIDKALEAIRNDSINLKEDLKERLNDLKSMINVK